MSNRCLSRFQKPGRLPGSRVKSPAWFWPVPVPGRIRCTWAKLTDFPQPTPPAELEFLADILAPERQSLMESTAEAVVSLRMTIGTG